VRKESTSPVQRRGSVGCEEGEPFFVWSTFSINKGTCMKPRGASPRKKAPPTLSFTRGQEFLGGQPRRASSRSQPPSMVPPPALADLAHSKRFTTPPTPLLSPLPRCIALRGRPPCHRTAGISFALLLLLSTPAEASRFEVDPDQWAAIGNVARDVHGIGRHAGAKLTRICPMAFAEDVKDECHAVQCYSRSSCRTLQSDAVSTSRLMLEGTNFNSLDAWKYRIKLSPEGGIPGPRRQKRTL
jgi:hypothetical protein